MEIDGELLRRRREEHVLTQVELAEMAGVTESTVNRLEKGLQRARISTVRKLACALDMQPRELIVFVDEGKVAA